MVDKRILKENEPEIAEKKQKIDMEVQGLARDTHVIAGISDNNVNEATSVTSKRSDLPKDLNQFNEGNNNIDPLFQTKDVNSASENVKQSVNNQGHSEIPNKTEDSHHTGGNNSNEQDNEHEIDNEMDNDPNKPEHGSEEWHRIRKINHKEVERRRRETINVAIKELQELLPSPHTNKSQVIRKAAEYIRRLKENENANIEKWTLEKLITDQAVNELAHSNDKLKVELEKAYREIEHWKNMFTYLSDVATEKGFGQEVIKQLLKEKAAAKGDLVEETEDDDEEEEEDVEEEEVRGHEGHTGTIVNQGESSKQKDKVDRERE